MLTALRIILAVPLMLICDIEMVHLGDDATEEDYGQRSSSMSTDDRPWWKRFLGMFWYRYRRPSEEDDAWIDSLG